jgi:hypothetical protein
MPALCAYVIRKATGQIDFYEPISGKFNALQDVANNQEGRPKKTKPATWAG